MQFEWDRAKDAENLRKHKITFAVAARVFDDEHCVFTRDRIDEDGELRWHATGMVDAAVLLVVHVYRSTINGEEIIRIISARKASKGESRRYFGEAAD
jgi:uncharacterized DUF497 family protein